MREQEGKKPLEGSWCSIKISLQEIRWYFTVFIWFGIWTSGVLMCIRYEHSVSINCGELPH